MESTTPFYNSAKAKWLLILIPFVIYVSSISYDYVMDDLGVIKEHRHVQSGVRGIIEIFSTNYRNGLHNFNDGLYRPLSLSIFAIFESIAPGSPFPGHLLNIIVYCLLIRQIYSFIFLLPLKKPSIISFWVSLAFAVLPIHTEIVANIKSLDELLGMLFGILACSLFISYAKSAKWMYLILSTLCFFLALLSKESSITYLGVIPVLIYIFYPNLSIKKVAISFSPFLFVGGVWLAIRHHVLASMPALDPEVFGLLNNPLTAISYYPDQLVGALSVQLMALRKLFIPYPLLHDYSYDYLSHPKFFSIQGVLLILFFISIIGTTLWGVFKKKPWAFGLAFYAITISPVTNILFMNSTIFGERLMFTPSLGIVMALVLILVEYRPFSKKWIIAAYLFVGGYAVMSFERQLEWRDDYTLKQADIKHLSASARANYNYATEIYKRYKDNRKEPLKTEAILYFDRAISIYPDYLDALNNKGSVHLFAREFKQAEESYLKVLALQPNYSKAQFNLAVVYQETEQYGLSVKHYQRSIELGRSLADAHYGLGYALGFLNRKEEAQQAFSACVQFNPSHAAAYLQLGKIFGERGQFDLAIEYFKNVLSVEPNHLDAQFYIGITYLNLENPTEGLKYLQRVQKLEPGYNNVDQIIASLK